LVLTLHRPSLTIPSRASSYGQSIAITPSCLSLSPSFPLFLPLCHPGGVDDDDVVGAAICCPNNLRPWSLHELPWSEAYACGHETAVRYEEAN